MDLAITITVGGGVRSSGGMNCDRVVLDVIFSDRAVGFVIGVTNEE